MFQAKIEQNVGKPSRVIHIRNIPSDVSESEIIHLGLPFGRVTNVLVLKGKNQAFLEMGDETSATSMVNYFANAMAQLRGRAVYVQFSNHKELKTDPTHSVSTIRLFCVYLIIEPRCGKIGLLRDTRNNLCKINIVNKLNINNAILN